MDICGKTLYLLGRLSPIAQPKNKQMTVLQNHNLYLHKISTYSTHTLSDNTLSGHVGDIVQVALISTPLRYSQKHTLPIPPKTSIRKIFPKLFWEIEKWEFIHNSILRYCVVLHNNIQNNFLLYYQCIHTCLVGLHTLPR